MRALLLLLAAGACGREHSEPRGRVEGDVYGLGPDRTVHRFAATPIYVIRPDSGTWLGVRTTCRSHGDRVAPVDRRVYDPAGDLMDIKLRTDSLKILIREISGSVVSAAWAAWRERRALSDTLADSIARMRDAATTAITAALTGSAVRRVVSNADAHFVADSLPPGRYILFSIAALGDTGLALPSMIRKYHLADQQEDDWVWIAGAAVPGGSGVTVDLNPANRVQPRFRLLALCGGIDSVVAARPWAPK